MCKIQSDAFGHTASHSPAMSETKVALLCNDSV